MLLFLVACGDSTRNSGGTTFTFFGWFADAEGAEPVSAQVTSFDTIVADGALFAGLQNNLAGQTITVDTVSSSYFVPGATVSIPSTVFPTSFFLRPTALGDDGGFGNAVSTLPEGSFGVDNVGFAQTLVVTPQIAEFLTLNRESFPPFPFDLIVTTTIEGVTSAGDRVETNAITFNFAIDSDLNIGADEGVALGGDEDAVAADDADFDAFTTTDDAITTVTGGDVTLF